VSTLDDATRARRPSDRGPREAGLDAGLSAAAQVHEHRQILLWPLELMLQEVGEAGPGTTRRAFPRAAEKLGPIWAEIEDELPDDPRLLAERHYREFVSFHPHVQRFLYGTREGHTGGKPSAADTPIRVFRRRDIAQVRIMLDAGARPIVADIAHVDLYFFHDVSLAMLAIEIVAKGLTLTQSQDLIYRLGRAYPSGWTESGEAAHCTHKTEWLDKNGNVLAASDYDRREKYLAALSRYRAPAIAAHWEFLLSPLVECHAETGGALAFRPVEYYRMPQMAYVAIDDPRTMTESDFSRLGLALSPGDSGEPPFGAAFLADFAQRYCYDRHHDPARTGPEWVDTRVVCCGHTFVLVGDARKNVVTDPERGVLARFRHQYFLLGLMAHFHRASLLMLSDRFVRIVNRLDLERPESVTRFRIDVRATHELFLRFSHRYWFSEVTDQAIGRDLFRLWSSHLETQRLYAVVREEIQDMSQYLDSDMLRRTSRTMVRLTVVAILSLIGTSTTGFIGMNIIDEGSSPLWRKLLILGAVATVATTLTVYTVYKARRLAEFLDALADERLPVRRKLQAFASVWKR
jgi:hypothetical protein